MEIERRGFLQLLFGGAVAVAAPAGVLAAVPETAASLTYAGKFQTMLGIRTKLLSANQIFLADTRRETLAEVTKVYREMMRFGMEHFARPDMSTPESKAKALAEVKTIFEEWPSNPEKRAALETGEFEALGMSEAATMLMFMRDALAVQKVHLDPAKIPEFKDFAEAYQDMILVGYRERYAKG